MTDKLIKALAADPEYREAWKANIAVAFQDAFYLWNKSKRNGKRYVTNYDLHDISNRGADIFLERLMFQSEQP